MLDNSLTQNLELIQKRMIIVARWLLKGLSFVVLFLAILWVGFVLWIHLEDYTTVRWLVIFLFILISTCIPLSYVMKRPHRQKLLIGYSVFCFIVGIWYVMLPAKEHRLWQPDVSQMLTVSRDVDNPDIVTLHNVRNFSWKRADNAQKIEQPMQPYFAKVVDDALTPDIKSIVIDDAQWTDRRIDLSKLSGVDIINSYWMGRKIAHTLISFRFKDDRPISFSFETRKQEGETFTTFGGFFKKYELSLIASEERDIIYTRSNVRGEQVYIFPIQGITQEDAKALFMQYLEEADSLNNKPQWYNTLTNNCTNIIYYLTQDIAGDFLPLDYRIWVSGYVPDYLYERGLLLQQVPNKFQDNTMQAEQAGEQTEVWTIEHWYKQAHINPKVADFSFEDNKDSTAYSQRIRQGLPMVKFVELAD